MTDISDSLRHELRDPEYSESYADSFLNAYIATQTKVIREQRQLTQAELATLMGTTQTAISRIENVNYSAWNIKTLKKLAKALHVRLRVSFETYGSLPDEVIAFGRPYLERDAREDDPRLWREAAEEQIRELFAVNQQESLERFKASLQERLKWSPSTDNQPIKQSDIAAALVAAQERSTLFPAAPSPVPLPYMSAQNETMREAPLANRAAGQTADSLPAPPRQFRPGGIVSGRAFRRRRTFLRKQSYARTGTGTGRNY